MQETHRYVISIAGFDPSAGAGVLADIKTFEQLGVYGLGVCSAVTVQTESSVDSVQWISYREIIAQLQALLEKYPVQFMKIGIVENFGVLKNVLGYLKEHYPDAAVIWDPVLKASAGFTFHDSVNQQELIDCCSKVFLLTPNATEATMLAGEPVVLKAAAQLQSFTQVLLKSYEAPDGMYDVLFGDGKQRYFKTAMLNGFEKHGSGCVLSAAVTAFLALGNDLKTSCELAKSYTFEFLQSTPGLLGTHHSIKLLTHAK